LGRDEKAGIAKAHAGSDQEGAGAGPDKVARGTERHQHKGAGDQKYLADGRRQPVGGADHQPAGGYTGKGPADRRGAKGQSSRRRAAAHRPLHVEGQKGVDRHHHHAAREPAETADGNDPVAPELQR